MKPIHRYRKFEKNFRVRVRSNPKLVKQFEERFALFITGYRDTPLNDHALTGNLAGKRSFSITGDIRVIYEETDTTITFIDIGTHSQVYK